MKREIFIAFLIVLMIFLVATALKFRYETIGCYSEFESFKENATEEINKLTEENKRILDALNERENEIDALKKEYENLSIEYVELNRDAEEMLKTIDEYKREIEASMEWFEMNSNIDMINDSFAREKLKGMLQSRCIEKNNDVCIINTGCIYLVNSEYFDAEYINDTSIYEEEDKLQSLDEFLMNGGGDCEDFSLFYRAEIGFLIEKCEGKEVVLDSWQPVEYEERFWLDAGHNWYLRYADGMFLKGYEHPYVVCGMLYDSVNEEKGGHCMIAISKEEINGIEDVELLNGAVLIEPQDGRFVDYIENKTILVSDEEDFDAPYYIYEVITENDLLFFSANENEWISFALFDERLDSIKERFID